VREAPESRHAIPAPGACTERLRQLLPPLRPRRRPPAPATRRQPAFRIACRRRCAPCV